MTDTILLAPDFPDSLQWLNTSQALELAELRGTIIVLEFWTSGSIACMHMHADMRYLQSKYRDNMLVIGIHTPKFPHDQLTDNVIKSINRQHIKYPVAHDNTKRLSTKYGIKTWPAIVLIDAAGGIIGRLQGEGKRRQLDALLKQCIDDAEQKGLLMPNMVSMHRLAEAPGVLNFPSKILATATHTYISDSGHNRVVEINVHGRVTRVFGSGGVGLLDGIGRDSAFNNPQGLVKVNDFLYVADCGNHAIRRIDLSTQDVMTIAGDGQIGNIHMGEFTNPTAVSLNSPRDLCYQNGVLYIAMAGQHQIWQLRLTDNTLSVIAGNGHIGLQDGKAHEAAFAQCCGIAADENRVYSCDAESSAIRMLRTASSQVSTLIGQGLSISGDADGSWSKALLQHPQAIALDKPRKLLYVADSYNSKIKVMNFDLSSISSLDAGRGLDEPDGLSLCDNTLWIANTNAHEIRKLNLLTREVEVVELNEPEQDF